MAYMDQERKAKLAAGVKAVMPKGWKYSLAVRNHSTIVCTISEAPVDLITALHGVGGNGQRHTEVNRRWFEFRNIPDDVATPMLAILDALNVGNHNRSDLQQDLHDVGWYVSLKIGRWDKPFKVAA